MSKHNEPAPSDVEPVTCGVEGHAVQAERSSLHL